MSDTLFSHPCDALDEFVAKLNAVPGVRVESGDGVGYSIRRLRSLYDYTRDHLPIKVGDLVRVNDDVTYGTSGLIVAGREGEVRYLDWNSHFESWSVVVEMSALWERTFRGPRGRAASGVGATQRELVETRLKLFSFALENLVVCEPAVGGDE